MKRVVLHIGCVRLRGIPSNRAQDLEGRLRQEMVRQVQRVDGLSQPSHVNSLPKGGDDSRDSLAGACVDAIVTRLPR